jgi:hypothetical protein
LASATARGFRKTDEHGQLNTLDEMNPAMQQLLHQNHLGNPHQPMINPALINRICSRRMSRSRGELSNLLLERGGSEASVC